MLDGVDPALGLYIERYGTPDQLVALLLKVQHERGGIAGYQHSAAVPDVDVVPVQNSSVGESAHPRLFWHEQRRSQADERIPMVPIRSRGYPELPIFLPFEDATLQNLSGRTLANAAVEAGERLRYPFFLIRAKVVASRLANASGPSCWTTPARTVESMMANVFQWYFLELIWRHAQPVAISARVNAVLADSGVKAGERLRCQLLPVGR